MQNWRWRLFTNGLISRARSDGSYNEFVSYGSNGYIDGGEYYESNDAGWDDDDYYESNDAGWDYYDDYDVYSDPGDYDEYSGWDDY